MDDNKFLKNLIKEYNHLSSPHLECKKAIMHYKKYFVGTVNTYINHHASKGNTDELIMDENLESIVLGFRQYLLDSIRLQYSENVMMKREEEIERFL